LSAGDVSRARNRIAICIVTSCPDAVNLTANYSSLVFLFFLLPPLTTAFSSLLYPSTALSIPVPDSAWQPMQKRGAVTKLGNANLACNVIRLVRIWKEVKEVR
jgi:hypothetical protein